MAATRVRVFVASAIAATVLVAWPTTGSVGRDRLVAAALAEDDRATLHVLNRIGFGPTAAAIEHVKRVGVQSYIDAQLHPERLPDTAMAARLATFTTLAKSSRELAEEYFVPAMMERRSAQQAAGQTPSSDTSPGEPAVPRTPRQTETMRMQRNVIGELSQQRILRAIYSERQLEEVLVDFWMNHFNVFVGKGQVRNYLTEYERDVVRPRVFGKFRDLLGATAQSPAMLFYLDNWQSAAPEGVVTTAQAEREKQIRRRLPPAGPPERRRQVPDPRTFDRMMAAGRATPQQQRSRGINENYARELMELHTLGVDGGYSQKDVQEVARAFTGWTIANPRLGGGFQFDPRRHDDGEKVVLGQRITSGGGRRDGEAILDLLARHPSTARFIATKLTRRLVADDPPAALVDRAARKFKETDGDIRAVVRTIVTSPEFLGDDYQRAKTKNPFEFVVSSVRATGLEIANALPLVQSLRDLGMPIYGAQPPTGYADRADAWVNSGALLGRMNFAVALASGRMRTLGPARPQNPAPAQHARQAMLSVALADDVSPSTAATVAKAATPAQTVALILGSPEFQKR